MWLLCASAAASSGTPDQSPAYKLRFETVRESNKHRIVAVNEGHAVLTIVSTITGENIASDRDWPMVTVINPGVSDTLGHVFAANPTKSYTFQTRFRYLPGDLRVRPDSAAAYGIPFREGFATIVSQAHGGEMTTHDSDENRYAIDFIVPERTEVLAARGGVVIRAEGGFTKGGKDPSLKHKANVVLVQHRDGTIASYAHLFPNGAAVRPGQNVAQGQLIGYSGSTGFSSGPHLHFDVIRATLGQDGFLRHESIPVDFSNYNPPVRFRPQQHQYVMASSGAAPSPAVPQSRSNHTATPASSPIVVTTVFAEPGNIIQSSAPPTHQEGAGQILGYPTWAIFWFVIGIALIVRLTRALIATFQAGVDTA